MSGGATVRMSRAGQRGMALAELMVAMTLALVLTVFACAWVIGANTGYVMQGEAARLDDGARFALASIGRAVRQGAFVDFDSGQAATPLARLAGPAITGADAHALGLGGDGMAPLLADQVNGSDVLAVRFDGTGPGAHGDGSILDCAGFGVGAAASGHARAWSIFYVAKGADGEAELRCKYRGAQGWRVDALVRGVDTFQVLYGLDTDEPADGLANTYVTANAIDLLDAALVLNGSGAPERARERDLRSHWRRVTGVHVALLLHGGQRTDTGKQDPVDVFGAAYQNGADRGTHLAPADLAPRLRDRVRLLVDANFSLRNNARQE